MKKYIPFILLFAILGTAQTCYGLAMEQMGPNSALGHPPGIQPEWPKGIFKITDQESRVYSIDINGNENIYFKATIGEINEIIYLFSKTRMRDHVVQIQTGQGKARTIRGEEIEYNVSLHIVAGLVLFFAREKQREDLPLEPQLTICTGNDSAIIKQLKWPENVIIENEVPGLSIESKGGRPKRDVFYGLLEFEDGSPPVEFVRNMNSRITLWQRDEEDGINIGSVNNKGYFTILLSEEELANLKKDGIWLTITLANFLTEVRKTDQRIPIEMLTRDKDKAQPVKVKIPEYYYGRILFEDGSPAVLDLQSWHGAEIMVDFPYAGSPQIDSQGYFKVIFTEEQYEKVKADKVRNNIYIPDPVETGTSTARFAFPVALLSRDKAKAGVVKIPRSIPPKQELATAESKIGKSIPGFEGVQFEEFQQDQAKDKPLLVCFWDMDQRPSRQCILTLEKQKKILQDKNIVVLAVHSGSKQEKEVSQWLKENSISIICGIIEGEPYGTLLAWGARGMPWLILTDEKQVITKEGFNIDELLLMK